MTNDIHLTCDGCGLPADSQHIAKRLQRLEWATRYRPIHIQTLLLSGISPMAEGEYLYSPEGQFQGEAVRLLELAGIGAVGKSREAAHTEFQRAGFFLAYVLECPWDGASQPVTTAANAMEKRAAHVATRIRRSLRPRRVALITELLSPLKDSFSSERLECPVVLDGSRAFALDGADSAATVMRLREALAANAGVAR